jgi:ribonuclease-3
MKVSNQERLTKALELLQPVLIQLMQQVYGENWETKVPQSSENNPNPKDIYNLFYVIIKRPKKINEILNKIDSSWASELINVRHNWAHWVDSSHEDIYRVLDTILRLLKSISENDKLSIDVQKPITEIEKQKQDVSRILLQEQNRREILDKPVSEKEEAKIRKQLEELLKRIPLENAYLLKQALTHRTYKFENPNTGEDNEQLEFFGDAVLQFLSGEFLYKNYRDLWEDDPKSGPKMMTKLRENLVSNEQLAKFAEELNLGNWILLGKGEKNQQGQEKVSLLSNCFEAVIGAYYLDSGMDAVRDFINPFFDKIIADLITIEEDNRKVKPESQDKDNPKGRLQELVCNPEFTLNPDNQAPVYETSQSGGTDNEPVFTSIVSIAGTRYAEGQGRSSKKAEKNAAENALKIIQGNFQKK